MEDGLLFLSFIIIIIVFIILLFILHVLLYILFIPVFCLSLCFMVFTIPIRPYLINLKLIQRRACLPFPVLTLVLHNSILSLFNSN